MKIFQISTSNEAIEKILFFSNLIMPHIKAFSEVTSTMLEHLKTSPECPNFNIEGSDGSETLNLTNICLERLETLEVTNRLGNNCRKGVISEAWNNKDRMTELVTTTKAFVLE
jgi:hypothetical protein